MTKWSTPPRIVAAATAVGLAFGLTACGDEEQQAYCADENGVVVDPDFCEESGGDGYFIYHSSGYPTNAKPGYKLAGGKRIAYNDSAARSKIGLPSSGKISSGGGFGGTAKVSGGGFGGGFGGSGGG